MEKIAITGIGIVSPLGIDKRKFWANIKAGRSAMALGDFNEKNLGQCGA